MLAKNSNKKFIAVTGSIMLLFTAIVFFSTQGLFTCVGPYSIALYDRKGVLLGAHVAEDGQWRFEPSSVPPKFEKCIILAEDKRFYFHTGVDPLSVARAMISNVKSKRIVSGASTITMQTIRLLEKNPARTFPQKIHESFLALMLECRLSKKSILSLYTSLAPFGGNVVGLEAASWRYFRRPPETLTWAESATLAVLPNQPSLVFPGANKDILQKKRDNLLNKLFEEGVIDARILDLSLQEKIPGKPYSLPSSCPHYLQRLKLENPLRSKFFSDIDLTLQKNTERILEKWSKIFLEKNINNSAALIIETSTGKILAYCGNSGLQAKDVDMVTARRSSGSLLKPFLYAAMLDNGMLLPDQLVIDIPTRIGSYKPDNNIPVYRGVVKAGEALSRSLNIPAIRELKEYGITAFLDYLRLCGFSTLDRSADDYGLPLILGGGEISMYEATRAYADIMNKACKRNVLKKDFPLSTGASYLTLQALAEGIRPDDESMWQLYSNSKKIAWKTGTSNGNRDAWAIGTTMDFTVAVWVGNASGGGNKEIKSNTCTAPLLFDMFSSLPQTHWPSFPSEDIEKVQVCKHSGYLASLNCSEKITAFKPKNAALGSVCPYCKKVSVTPDEKYRASVSDMKEKYAGTFPVQKSYFVLPPVVEYFYTKQTLGYKPLPPYLPWHKDTQALDLQIVFPEEGALIIIPTEINGTPGSTVLQAAERNKDATLYWDIDGQYIGSTLYSHKIAVRPSQGDHILTVTDSRGAICKRKFSIVTETN